MRRLLLPIAIGLVITGAALTGLHLARPGTMNPAVAPMEGTATLPFPVHPAPSANPTPPLPSAPSPATAQTPAKTPVTRQRQVLDIPGMRKLHLKVQDSLIDSKYGRLFRQFGLNQEETECFKRLLADRDTRRMDLNNTLLDPALPPQQRPAVAKSNISKLAAIDQASDAAIRRFLNHEGDFRIYQEWEDTAPERQQATSLNSIFAATGHRLSPEQSDQLVDVTVAIRKASRPAPTIGAARTRSGKASDLRAQQERLRAEADDQNILAQSASFLSPEQLQTLQQALEGWRMVKNPAQPAPRTARK